MRVTVDIPDHLYEQLKAKAATEGSSIKQIIVGLIDRELRASGSKTAASLPRPFPLIKGKAKRTLRITNQEIDEILFG
ncbi:MAG: hypothetical protein WD733_22585 [Bryobacterales bacterium]